MPGMPSAKRKRGSDIFFFSEISRTRFSEEISPYAHPKSASLQFSGHTGRPGYEPDHGAINCSTTISPSPSMSTALLAEKCRMDSRRCAEQAKPPTHLWLFSTTVWVIVFNRFSFFICTTADPQTGHISGILKGFSCPVRFSVITPMISGMTSPARRTITMSPTRISSLALFSLIACLFAFNLIFIM